MKKRYYHDHEGAYRTIRERGEFGWQAPTRSDFEKAKDKELLTSIVDEYFPVRAGKTALDLGCGTGPTAHTLFDLGFQTTGIDISETAIELAQKLAREEGKDISFQVADVITYEGKFDFIYDSHCFHCIVTDFDRRLFLERIKSNLVAGGAAFLNTMAWIPGYTPDLPGLRFDHDYILWHPTKDSSREGCALFKGSWWCPQRRILPVEMILKEISATGLRILYRNTETHKTHPDLLQLLVSL
ncbi:MAG: class I SAM-dependent methyltransferase [Bacteriovoracaceae bacterium]